MAEVSKIITKVIAAVVIASVFPLVMVSLNEMNTTGFTAIQIAAGTLIGLVLAFGFVSYAAKDI